MASPRVIEVEDEEVVNRPKTPEKRPTERTLTFNETVHGITEFIEVAIHTILYVRQIYPADLFVRRKKFDTPVFRARHPALDEYISGAVKAIRDELVTRSVDKVIMVIKDNKDDVALERFIFSVRTMIEVEAYNKDTSVSGAMTHKSLTQYFRAFLVKIFMIENTLGRLNLGDDGSFAIVLELNDGKAPSVTHGKDPPPWVPGNKQHTTVGASDKAELYMLRSVETGIIDLALSIQESEAKLSRTAPEPEYVPDRKGKRKADEDPPEDRADGAQEAEHEHEEEDQEQQLEPGTHSTHAQADD